MKELHFTYWMKLSFDTPVCRHRFTLKCVPVSNERQEIADLWTDVYPNEFLSEGWDSFGNRCIYGYAEGEHDHFSVRVTGRARTGLAPSEHAAPAHQVGLYKYQTAYTEPGPHLRALAAETHLAPGLSALERAQALTRALRGKMRYVQGVTDIHTTAEQALALGQGVCQDYAHILLSLCRMHGIPCRYVVGLLEGEGLSHAWVEVCGGGRWFALDPTNDLLVDDQHIKLSSGRDYQDCVINHGIFTGQARQTQEAGVLVRPLEA